MMTPEFELALACCRWSFSGEQDEAIARLAGGVDWAHFLHLIRRHRVQGLVARALRENKVCASAAVEDSISNDALAIAERNLRSTQMCSTLLERFAGADISLLFFKGLTLSALAYRDPYVKLSADIDILVEPARVGEASAILEELGFEPVVPPGPLKSADILAWHARHKESAWHCRQADLDLDLHTQLSDNRALIPAIGLSSRRQQVSLGHGQILPTLANDDLFAYLCVHGAGSAWFRLKWLVDLVAFVRNAGHGEVERLYRHAVSAGAGRGPAQGLLLADSLSLLDLPSGVRTELRRDSMSRFLARLASRVLLHPDQPTERRLGTAPIHVSQLLLFPGWRFTVSEIGRQARQILWQRA